MNPQSALLEWYHANRRSLPWRESATPYRVWLSEVMLQQTQVATVVPYFERFVKAFPDVDALASATEQEVLAAWSGLGYYRRARALHRAAKTIVNELAGEFPDDVSGWMALPGIGRYTAGAIVSIAFDKRAPILDGNVMRVLSRWFAVHGDPRIGTANRELWRLAETILPAQSISDFNQALMELGALVCTPQNPRCLVCPLCEHCEARRRGIEHRLPQLAPRRESVKVRMAAAIIEREGSYLMYRRTGTGVMEDMWEFPGGECLDGESPRVALVREGREKYGLAMEPSGELAKIKHNIMNRRIELHAFSAGLEALPATDEREHRWVARSEIDSIPVSSMVPKLLAALDER